MLAVEGAEVVTVPAAFTLFTGKDHWELLLRARAVENQCYVVAANQWGVRGRQGGLRALADRRPVGSRARRGPDEDCVISAEIDRARMEDIRRRLPSLANRQPAAYRSPTGV